jgi:hypothetical protein
MVTIAKYLYESKGCIVEYPTVTQQNKIYRKQDDLSKLWSGSNNKFLGTTMKM